MKVIIPLAIAFTVLVSHIFILFIILIYSCQELPYTKIITLFLIFNLQQYIIMRILIHVHRFRLQEKVFYRHLLKKVQRFKQAYVDRNAFVRNVEIPLIFFRQLHPYQRKLVHYKIQNLLGIYCVGILQILKFGKKSILCLQVIETMP